MKTIYEGRCIHCHQSIRYFAEDLHPVWTHVGRQSVWCRDSQDLLLYRFAEPFRTLTSAELMSFVTEASNNDHHAIEHTIDMINTWLGRGDGAAVYENVALDSYDLGRKICLSYGSSAAQIEELWPPQRCPDLKGVLVGWPYQIVGIYRGEPLVKPSAFVNENWKGGHNG